MSFALLIIGAVMLVSAIRGTNSQLWTLVQGDFTGTNNFVFWTISILLIGSLGYIPKLKPFSTVFLILVLLVLILTRGNPNGIGGGFFQKFTQQIASTTTTPAPATASTTGASVSPFSGLSSFASTLDSIVGGGN